MGELGGVIFFSRGPGGEMITPLPSAAFSRSYIGGDGTIDSTGGAAAALEAMTGVGSILDEDAMGGILMQSSRRTGRGAHARAKKMISQT